ncbi:MAG: hypothetical protein HZA48_01985 [Planctomycetes bacterium]|nr:hypothetical protein [Planctomycetota bacterium]
MKESPYDQIMNVLRKDPRYALGAYRFIYEALDFTVQKVTGEKRHVTGQELLMGIRLCAAEHFGPLARMVFNTWGVYKPRDFGEIVFNLVNAGLMGRTETDSVDDFDEGFDIDTVFWEDFYSKEIKIQY